MLRKALSVTPYRSLKTHQRLAPYYSSWSLSASLRLRLYESLTNFLTGENSQCYGVRRNRVLVSNGVAVQMVLHTARTEVSGRGVADNCGSPLLKTYREMRLNMPRNLSCACRTGLILFILTGLLFAWNPSLIAQ